jgi:hypothetical protein
VDADAELDALDRRDIGVSRAHSSLHLGGTAQSVYYAGEFYKDTVAGCFEDTSPMFGDLGVDQPTAQRFEPRQRAFLIRADQSRVANNTIDRTPALAAMPKVNICR